MNSLPIIMLILSPTACLVMLAVKNAKRVALLASAVNLFLGLLLAAKFSADHRGWQFETDLPWLQLQDFFRIHFHLGIDGINLPLILLNLIVTLVAIAVTPEDMKRSKEFFICALLISVGALGAFLSLDLFFLYIFHEIALVPTFLLIGGWGSFEKKVAAWRMIFYLLAGSLIALIGLLAFYFLMPAGVRTFDLPAIYEVLKQAPFAVQSQKFIFLFLLIGFGILVSLWPFYNWAPQGYAAAPPAVAMLHAGVLKKFGLYGLLRIAIPCLPQGMTFWTSLLLVLLTLNIIYIGWVTIAQKELDLMLGYSSVMHMGYLFLGLASVNVIGLTGMVVLMVAHGLSISLLFGLAHEIRLRTSTFALHDMGGLAKKAPSLAFLFIVGALAAMGLPGLANFSGEILIFFGAWKEYFIVTIFALWGVVLSAIYMLRAVKNIFFGELDENLKYADDLRQKWPYIILVLVLLAIGIWPNLLAQWIQPAVKNLLGT